MSEILDEIYKLEKPRWIEERRLNWREGRGFSAFLPDIIDVDLYTGRYKRSKICVPFRAWVNWCFREISFWYVMYSKYILNLHGGRGIISMPDTRHKIQQIYSCKKSMCIFVTVLWQWLKIFSQQMPFVAWITIKSDWHQCRHLCILSLRQKAGPALKREN